MRAAAGFSYRTTKDGTVFIGHNGRDATTLRGDAARRFLARVAKIDTEAAQGLMARVTGNYKRGNERG